MITCCSSERGYEVAQQESWLEGVKISSERNLEVVIQRMFSSAGHSRQAIGTELDVVSLPQLREINHALKGRKLLDISPQILAQRMIKEDGEIHLIRKACSTVHAGHQAAVSVLRPGMSELELSAAVENAHRLSGHEGHIFTRNFDFVMSRGPLASGPNLRQTSGTVFTLAGAGLSSAVPTGASRRIMQPGDLVMIDIAVCVEGYHADQSRTYSVGRAQQKTVDLFRRLREVADHTIDGMRPGVTSAELYRRAFYLAGRLGLSESFMRFHSGATAHFIGHGVGLEINEPPLLSAKSEIRLAPGMVLALELHLTEPVGHVIKLEDTLIIGEKKTEILTFSPRKLIQVLRR
jgi:Xaa-Pro dipeptidase